MYAPHPGHHCPTCNSPSPEMHPAVQFEGEVEVCVDDYHLIPTNRNRPEYIANALAKRHIQDEVELWMQYGEGAEICKPIKESA